VAQLGRLDWRPCAHDDDEVDDWFREVIHVGWDRIEVNIPLSWDNPDRIPAAELFRYTVWGRADRAVFHSTGGDALTKLLIVAHVLELRSRYQNPHWEVPRDEFLHDYACTRALAARHGLGWDSWLSDKEIREIRDASHY
jgi:hypothetical protein